MSLFLTQMKITCRHDSTNEGGYLLLSINWTPLINGFANDIDDPTKSLWSYRNPDRGASVNARLTTDKTFSTIHSNSPDSVLSCEITNEM